MSDISDIRKDVMAIIETCGKLAGPIPPDKDLYSDLGVESVNAIRAPQQNLWVSSGSGNAPSL